MTIYIVDIEPVETRYTAQWKEHLPKQLQKHCNQQVVTVSGGETPQMTTPGAFLNFAGTNIYKSTQSIILSTAFLHDQIKDGDHFIFTDAWNPTIIQLKYMADLLDKKITMDYGMLAHTTHKTSWEDLSRTRVGLGISNVDTFGHVITTISQPNSIRKCF